MEDLPANHPLYRSEQSKSGFGICYQFAIKCPVSASKTQCFQGFAGFVSYSHSKNEGRNISGPLSIAAFSQMGSARQKCPAQGRCPLCRKQVRQRHLFIYVQTAAHLPAAQYASVFDKYFFAHSLWAPFAHPSMSVLPVNSLPWPAGRFLCNDETRFAAG